MDEISVWIAGAVIMLLIFYGLHMQSVQLEHKAESICAQYDASAVVKNNGFSCIRDGTRVAEYVCRYDIHQNDWQCTQISGEI